MVKFKRIQLCKVLRTVAQDTKPMQMHNIHRAIHSTKSMMVVQEIPKLTHKFEHVDLPQKQKYFIKVTVPTIIARRPHGHLQNFPQAFPLSEISVQHASMHS